MSKLAHLKNRQLDPKAFLAITNGGRKILAFPKKQTTFAQGDSSDVFICRQERLELHTEKCSNRVLLGAVILGLSRLARIRKWLCQTFLIR